MQHFAAQFQPAQQTTRSLRASQYKSSKRKRTDDEPQDEHDHESPPPSSYAESYASFPSFPSPEPDQLRVAGLLPDDGAEIPSKPFPHAPARSPLPNLNYQSIQKSLTELDPPLFAVNATSGTHDVPALRQTHLAVLTTIMHRCLLEADFPRAGRAWGLILRSQIAGTPVDPRNHGRWGIGAELLLHRNTGDEQSTAHEKAIYSEEGFELAREYYERLIVQHPNRKHQPRALDDLTFYPAMFSLWVYEVCERSRRARKKHEEDNRIPASGSGFDEDTTMTSEDASALNSAIVDEELQQGKQIARRLDQLITSPPFDKHADLLQLRGMVGLWLGDLILGKQASPDMDWNEDSHYGDSEDEEPPPEKLQRYAKARTEYRQAMDNLIRAETNGRHLAPLINSVDAKIEYLSRKIAILSAG